MSSDDIKVPLVDVRPDHWAIVQGTLQKHVPQCEVWAFGSRAKWTAKPYSDLDLAVICDQPLSLAASAALAHDLSESDLPWKVDIVDWATTSESFRSIIARDKVVVQRPNISLMKLEDCMSAIIDYRGKTPKKTNRGVPLVTAKIVKGGRIEEPTEFIAPEDFNTWMTRGLPMPGDVVLTTEAPLGEVAQLDDKQVALAQRIITLRGKQGILDNTYLKFVLQGEFVQHQLRGRASGSTVSGIKQSELRKVTLPVPAFHEQLAIAQVLGALDGKIEINRRTNATLEAMAHSVFKDWFIDFGPVRAKLEGLPPYLAPDIWSLFPDEGNEDGIPKGWHLCTLKELTTKIGSGSTPRGGKEVYVDEGIALIRSQNVYDSEFVWSGLARITDQAAKQLSNVEVMRDDVLLNITGASILRTCVVEPGAMPARVNQHVAIIRAKDGIPCRFLHLHLLQKATKDYLMGLNAGASREAVTKAHIESVPILNPGAALLGAFEKTVAPIYAEVEALVEESRSLAQIRDILLPKLISGELRISNPREFLEESTA